jgi:hypothetical protein
MVYMAKIGRSISVLLKILIIRMALNYFNIPSVLFVFLFKDELIKS